MAASQQNHDKMAVTSDNVSAKTGVSDTVTREDNDNKPGVVPKQEVTQKKKSTFKITSVTKRTHQRPQLGESQNDADADSNDDLDETVESHTEDLSSEILDSSRYELGDQDTPLDENTQIFGHDGEAIVTKETVVTTSVTSTTTNTSSATAATTTVKERSDVHSTRFKVVKIETKEPFKRGRWVCCDSLNTPPVEKSESRTNSEEQQGQGNSGNSSASGSLHYVHGVDDPSKNPLQSTVSQNHLHGTMDAGYVSQSDGTVSQGEMFNQPSHGSIAHIPNTLPTHLGQNYTNMGMASTGSSPSHGAQPLSANIHTVHHEPHQAVGTNQGHPKTPMQFQNIDSKTPGLPMTEITSNTDYQQVGKPDHPMLEGTGGAVAKISSSSNQVESDNAMQNEQKNGPVPELFIDPNTGVSASAAQILTPLAVGAIASSPVREDAESGSSTVALDNKIEQAMDLVKSHLMYTVREEVEVLKEQIKELLERNSQLEYENSVLRSEANPDTLTKLAPQRQQQPPPS